MGGLGAGARPRQLLRYHRDAFLALLPPPGRLTVDAGCGEGRLGRDLAALGHRVVALDRSPSMVRAAAAAGGPPVLVADAAAVPLADGCADLAVAFMRLHDIDDLAGATRELGRVLALGGLLAAAIVHPINSGGDFGTEGFRLRGGYFKPRHYSDTVDRAGHAVTFHSIHRPLRDYARALAAAGFAIEALEEMADDRGRSADIPLFLHLRCRQSGGAPRSR